ncbi:MAG: sensor domain-containing diguanylate cyclase [Proteobacteria bacterium]|nr:sensor domain-containing diguanylate cyclase [Pseudomonadota bacterium]
MSYLALAIAVGVALPVGFAIWDFLRLTRKLRESEERWKFALEGAGDGVWDWNVQSDTVVFSQRYKEMAGYTDEDIAANEEAWRHRIHPDDRVQVDQEIHACLQGRTKTYCNEHRVICRDGSVKWVLARGMIVSRSTDDKPLRMIGTHADITERKNMEERMRHMAHYDLLTELPNRALITERLQQAVIKARRDKTHMAVMFLDLDRFKPVNDTLGHDIGDLLLKQVAGRLSGSMRASDTVARLGGDEFVVLLHAIDHEHDAAVVAGKILHALNQPFRVADHEISISGSIGIAAYPQHGEDEKLLLINADIAMYHAKKAGRNDYRFFAPDMQ